MKNNNCQNLQRKIATVALIVSFFQFNLAYSWEPFDRVIAVVNDIPIVESEVLNKFSQLQKLKKIPKKKLAYEKSRVLDKFIEYAIVSKTAENESLIISDEKVNSQIKKIMERMKIDSLDNFKRGIETKENISFSKYKEELKKNLLTEQVMSFTVGVSPPTKKEAKEWYRKNKKKLGFQVNLKHILLIPKNNSFKEEKRVNYEINKYRKLIFSGKTFEGIARKHSQDLNSAKKGGDLGWVMISELDPYFASQVNKMNKKGQISKVIKSGYGYHLVKYLGRRDVPYDFIENWILNLLFQKNLSQQFKKWVTNKRQLSDVKIYMDNYKS